MTDILYRVRAVLEPSGAWTRFEQAVNKDGQRTFTCRPDAVAWSLLGAIAKSAKDIDEFMEARNSLKAAHSGDEPWYWPESQEQALALIDKAVAAS